MTARTHGPVARLEQHLAGEWWKAIFNATYLRTDGDVVENPENTHRDTDMLVRAADVQPDTRLLDVCCGQGRHCLELARRGHRHVSGVDRSRYLITVARKRARAAGLAVSLHEGDARSFKLPEAPFDVVSLLGNSFGYFDRDEDDRKVLRAVHRALAPGGTLALDITDGAWIRDNFERRSWEWIGAEELVCRERELSSCGTRLVSREVVVHARRGVVADQFYAQRLYDPAALVAMLEDEGFGAVSDHAAKDSASDRNQDLGMMERTFFLTARKGAARVVRAVPAPAKDVLVLLGDPRSHDPIRPNGELTVDDDAALRKLRDAFGSLEGFAFRYHDDHATLLETLRARPPELVVNFCDEGFRNDLRAELHVPALLEVLGIPYTGAGPACLGLCVDKAHARAIAISLGVPVPRELRLPKGAAPEGLDVAYPALVKPRVGDGSVGIDRGAVVRTPDELRDRVVTLRASWEGDVLVQEFLPGAEYSVGLLGDGAGGLDVLPILEVDYDALPPELPRLLGYESKWNFPETPYWTHVSYKRASLAPAAQAALEGHARLLFEQLGCRDYARLDFRAAEDGTIRFLEANPNPGWGWGDELNYMADWAGLPYAELLRRIVASALARVASARAARGGSP